MWRHLFLIPVYLLACSLPLALPIGANLEYEYALLTAYATLLLVPLAGLLMPRTILPMTQTGEFQPRVAFDVLWLLLVVPMIGLIPGVTMFVYGGCPCSKTGFLFWMGILWLPAMVLAHAILAAIVRSRMLGASKKFIVLILTALYVACTTSVIVTLWFHPQKRIVDFVAGFLHGPVYDDWISFDLGMMLARSAHLALALGLFLMASITRRTPITIIATILVIASAFGLNIAADRFYSVKNGKKHLDELMFSSLPGDGYTLRYRPAPTKETENDRENDETASVDPNDPEATSANVPLAIQRIHRDAQFHIQELRKILGSSNKSESGKPKLRSLPHVEIYVYPNDEKKKLWFGGGATDITDVYTPTVHIAADTWPHPTLRHELVHALTSNLAFHGLGFHPNMAFTEGLAVALAPNAATLSLDDGAASLIESRRIPDIDTLFSPMFWQVSGQRAYTAAGSFIKFLIDTKGIDGVLALYAGDSWKNAFQQDRDTLVKQWKTQILARYDRDKHALYTEALFRNLGLFADNCPHSKADLSRARRESVFTRMRQPIGWDPNTDYLDWLIQLDPKNNDARLRLWRREIRKVATDRYLSEGRATTWRDTLRGARLDPPNTLEDVEMALLESDLTRILGDVDASVTILRDLAQRAKTKYFGESLNRDIEARLHLEEQLGPELALEWRKFLAGWRRNLPQVTSGAPWLLTYLRLRNERSQAFDAAELSKLVTEMPDPKMSQSFHFEWYRILASHLMRAGRFLDAAKIYDKAAEGGTSGNRELFFEHARRARFYEERGPLRAALPTATQTSL